MGRVRRGLVGVGWGVGGLLLAVLLLLTGFRVAASRREIMSRHDAAPRTGHFVRAADVEMFVQEEGPSDGAPIVLVHGTGAWSEIWRSTSRALASEGYHVVALDMPPFGYSSRPASGDYGDDAQGQRILGAIDALRLSRVTLVGHSFGGRPTMQATFIAPARVERLVLVDAALDLSRGSAGPRVRRSAPATWPSASPQGRGLAVAAPPSFPPSEPSGPWLVRAVLGVGPLRDAIVAATLSNPRMTAWLLSKLVFDRESAVTPSRVSMLQRPFVLDDWTPGLGEWLTPFATTRTSTMATDRARYATLTMPTLVIWGAHDAITPLAQGEDLAQLIRGAQLRVLPTAGHIPAIEDEDGFSAALLDFLDATSTRAK